MDADFITENIEEDTKCEATIQPTINGQRVCGTQNQSQGHLSVPTHSCKHHQLLLL